jgi:hypothetical protein
MAQPKVMMAPVGEEEVGGVGVHARLGPLNQPVVVTEPSTTDYTLEEEEVCGNQNTFFFLFMHI